MAASTAFELSKLPTNSCKSLSLKTGTPSGRVGTLAAASLSGRGSWRSSLPQVDAASYGWRVASRREEGTGIVAVAVGLQPSPAGPQALQPRRSPHM